MRGPLDATCVLQSPGARHVTHSRKERRARECDATARGFRRRRYGPDSGRSRRRQASEERDTGLRWAKALREHTEPPVPGRSSDNPPGERTKERGSIRRGQGFPPARTSKTKQPRMSKSIAEAILVVSTGLRRPSRSIPSPGAYQRHPGPSREGLRLRLKGAGSGIRETRLRRPGPQAEGRARLWPRTPPRTPAGTETHTASPGHALKRTRAGTRNPP